MQRVGAASLLLPAGGADGQLPCWAACGASQSAGTSWERCRVSIEWSPQLPGKLPFKPRRDGRGACLEGCGSGCPALSSTMAACPMGACARACAALPRCCSHGRRRGCCGGGCCCSSRLARHSGQLPALLCWSQAHRQETCTTWEQGSCLPACSRGRAVGQAVGQVMGE
jgi:hypothetical protein